ncbi:hypothetical protein EAO77_07885 [Streptomyces sp. t39]|nr:hypothetical protein EAO77_07885 [Streptomyces sp. t39]
MAVAGGLAASLFGLRLFGNVLDLSGGDDHEVPLSAQQRNLVLQIEDLRSDDGLYTVSMGSAAKPGLYESAHGLTALKAADGEAPSISLTVESLHRAFADEMSEEPFSSAVWISQIEAATGKRLHREEDRQALLQRFSPQGFFRDPASESDSLSTRLNDTSSALAGLAQFGVELTAHQRAAIRQWLAQVGNTAPRRPVQLYHLEYIAEAIGVAPPTNVAEGARQWWRAEGRLLDASADEEDTIEAAYYILLANRLGWDLTEQRRHWEAVLSPDEPVSTDTQVSALTARAWTSLKGSAERLDPLVQRISKRRLPTGVVSSVQVRHGSLTSAYEVVRLRMVVGLPIDDPELRAALTKMKPTVLGTYDPLLRGAWLSLMDSVGGPVSARERRRIVADVTAGAPRTVDVRNVDVWNRFTDILVGLDEAVPHADVRSWEPDRPEYRYARSLLINSLHRTGRLDDFPAVRPRPAELVAEAEERLQAGTVREGAEALSAASALGWTPTHEDAERITALLEKRRDCPGASAFYRDSAKDDECGVPGTRAAYRISALLEGAMPAITRTP